MGRSSMRTGPGIPAFLAALLIILHGVSPADAGAQRTSAGLLDGKVFLVEKGENGKKADGKDTYIFLAGTFRSANYEKDPGFVEGAYAASQQGDAITFTAALTNGSHGTLHWEGTVQGGRIEARYTWTGRKPKWYRSTPLTTEHWAKSVTTWATEDPGPPGGGPPSNLLDGKTYRVRTGEQGKKASHHNDYLVFRDGRFVSSDCVEALDFRESTYSTTSTGDGIRFRATTTSPNHGTMVWDGTIRGKELDATARWVHERWYWTIDRVYWFKGKLLE